jgi:hypothetical protein
MTPSFQLNKLRAPTSRAATHQWQIFVFLPAWLMVVGLNYVASDRRNIVETKNEH